MRFVSTAVVLAGMLAGVSLPVRAGGAAGPAGRAGERGRTVAAADARTIVDSYCAGCHNGTMRSPSGAPLDQFDTSRMSEHLDMWSRAYRQLVAGTMPPFGAPRPDRATTRALLDSIETSIGGRTTAPASSTSAEIAGRLASLLWNADPDAPLRQDAERNLLTRPDVLERQVRRMLGDDRADAFVSRFFFPWLGLDQLGKADPDTKHFPEYNVTLRQALETETRMFIRSQLRDDRDPIELWSANYTFVNEQLARHYGMRGVTGTQFRRTALTAPERAGLLGQGSIHMVTSRHQHGSDAGYTSPASRSVWVRLRFLGAPPPRAFPNAAPVKPELPITPQTRTLPAEPCVNCHRNFFPLGYALENFDPIGRWRTHDQAGAIDATGTFVDGTPTNGVVDLRKVLLQRPDAFRTAITEKLVLYASGGPVNAGRMTPHTLVRARQVLNTVRSPRWSSLIAEAVRTTP